MAEENTQSVETTVREIRRKTRKKYSAEEKVRIVLEGLRGEDTIAELCRREGIQIKVKIQKGTIWMALAIWVPTRLWKGGVISPKRDLDLIQALADQVHKMALCRPLLLAVDGLASYVSAFRNAFRSKFPRQAGETGHCKMVAWQDIAIVQVVKQRVEGVLNVDRWIVQGAQDKVEHLIQTTQGKGVINTAFIERLNATFRQRIDPLTRRTRTLAQRAETLLAGMYIVGCFYNFSRRTSGRCATFIRVCV